MKIVDNSQGNILITTRFFEIEFAFDDDEIRRSYWLYK